MSEPISFSFSSEDQSPIATRIIDEVCPERDNGLGIGGTLLEGGTALALLVACGQGVVAEPTPQPAAPGEEEPAQTEPEAVEPEPAEEVQAAPAEESQVEEETVVVAPAAPEKTATPELQVTLEPRFGTGGVYPDQIRTWFENNKPTIMGFATRLQEQLINEGRGNLIQFNTDGKARTEIIFEEPFNPPTFTGENVVAAVVSYGERDKSDETTYFIHIKDDPFVFAETTINKATHQLVFKDGQIVVIEKESGKITSVLDRDTGEFVRAEEPTEEPEATATLTAEQKTALAWEEAERNSKELFRVEGEGLSWRTLVHNTLSDLEFEAVVQDKNRAIEFVLNTLYLHAQSYYSYPRSFDDFKTEWQSIVPVRNLEVILSEQTAEETELSNLPTIYTVSNQSVMDKLGWWVEGDTARLVVKMDPGLTKPGSHPWNVTTAMLHVIQSMGLKPDTKGNVSMQLSVVRGTRFYQGFYPIFAGGEIDEANDFFYVLAVRLYNKSYPRG